MPKQLIALVFALVSAHAELMAQVIPDGNALWPRMKRELQSDNGQRYFELGLRDALLPAMTGEVLSCTSVSDQPNELVGDITGKGDSEVLLRIAAPGKTGDCPDTRSKILVRFKGIA